MAHCGAVVARYQIMKSNKLAGSAWRTSVATSGSTCSADVSIHPALQAATKRSRGVIAVASDSSRVVMKKAKVSRCIAPPDLSVPPSPPLKRAEARLTNTFLLLVGVPIVASTQEIMSTLLSGLSISNFYLCGLPAEITAGISVSVFVEFSSLDGAELGLRRSGESLVHRPISADEQLRPHANPSPVSHLVVRSTVSIHATTDQQAAWVRAAAWRLLSPGSHSMLSHMQLLGEFAGRHRGLAMLSMAAAMRIDDHWLVAMKLAVEFHKDRTMTMDAAALIDGSAAAKVVVNQQDVRIVGPTASMTRMRSPIHADRLLHLLDGGAEDIIPQEPAAVGFALVEGGGGAALRPGGAAPSFGIYRAALDMQHSLLIRSVNAAEAEVSRLSTALADLLLVTHSSAKNQRDSAAAASASAAAAPDMAKYVVGHMNRRLTLYKHLSAHLRLACNTYIMHPSCAADVG